MRQLITDKSFDLNRTSEYNLSIQVSLDGFSFLVTHPEEQRLIALKNTPVTISDEKFLSRRFAEWVTSEKILSQTFANIKISYYTEEFTLVPLSFYIHEKQKIIASLLFGQQSNAQIIQNSIEGVDSKLIFMLPDKLKTQFDEKFDHSTLLHPATVLVQKTKNLFAPNESGVTLFFTPNSFLLSLYDQGNLILANSFKFTHANDVLYFILTALKQCGMNTKKCKLLLAGEIFQEQEIENLLKNYFNKIDFLIPELKSNAEIFKEPMHRFLPLF